MNATGGYADDGSNTGTGIGSGGNRNGGSVTISGGTVNATAGGSSYFSFNRSAIRSSTITLSHVDGASEPVITASGGNNAYSGTITLEKDFAYQDTTNIVTTPIKNNSTIVPVETWTVTFDANGGEGTMAAQKVIKGISGLTLPDNAFTRTSYTFTGWNTAADGSGTAYADKASVTPTGNMTLYAQWKHEHSFTYTLSDDGKTITATCGQEACSLPEKKATLTISAPAGSLTYDSAAKAATVTGEIPGVTTPEITYAREGDASFTGTPKDAGTYTASITVESATASVEYTVAKAGISPTLSIQDKTYDGNEVTYTIENNPGGGGVTSFSWEKANSDGSWSTVDETPKNVGTYRGTAVIAETDNYQGATTNTAEFTISKAAAKTLADVNVTQVYTLADVSASVAGKLPGDAGALTYAKGTESKTGSVTVSGWDVDGSGNVTATLSGGAADDTVTLPVTISSTNYADSTVNVVITLTPKNDAVVSITGIPPKEVQIEYGDTFVPSGLVQNSGTNGSWTWTSSNSEVFRITPGGEHPVIDALNAGSATITASYVSDTTIGTFTTESITVHPRAITITANNKNIYVGDAIPALDDYKVERLLNQDALTTAPTLVYQKNGEVVTPDNTTAGTYDIVPSGASAGNNYSISYTKGTLTISEKQTATVTKAPEAKTLTYNGQAQALVTAGSTDGGTMQYAAGNNAATAPAGGWSGTIPTATEAGTYYVWYRVKGNENYNDTEPQCITVTIDYSSSFVAAKDPTETEAGNKAYYVRNDGKWFWDALWLAEITDHSEVIIPATGKKEEQSSGSDGTSESSSGGRPSGSSSYGGSDSSSDSGNAVAEQIIYSDAGGRSTSVNASGTGSGTGSSAGTTVSGQNTVPGSGSTSQTVSMVPAAASYGSWSQTGTNWTYRFADGTDAADTWAQIAYLGRTDWYFFGVNRYMHTGWLYQNGRWYYLNPESDGTKGRLVTGWVLINGKWYYFEPVAGRDQGHMYVNERTPDGYYVGPDGAWDGRPAQ